VIPPDADRKLREAAQLWALARKLPHVPTAREQRLLQEFTAFAAGQKVSCEYDAVLAGIRSLWTRHDLLEILRFSRKLPAGIGLDREVRTYVAHARRLVGAVRRRHRSHRHAATGLNDLLNAWDPIGVAESVSDEYSMYLGGLVALLADGADEAGIAEELTRIVTDRMGLRVDSKREREHAAAMVSWYRRVGQARG